MFSSLSANPIVLRGQPGALCNDGSLCFTVIFSHPPLGSVGLTEPKAKQEYGADQISTKQARFSSLKYAMNGGESQEDDGALKVCFISQVAPQVPGLFDLISHTPQTDFPMRPCSILNYSGQDSL